MFFNKTLPLRVRLIAKRSLFKGQLISSQFRALPEFVIIGAQKSGTSSLYNYLSQHSQIQHPLVHKKEVHFFDGGLDPKKDSYRNGIRWYRAHFPLEKGKNNERIICGEASPLYLFNPLVPNRMKESIPNTKLIVILRDPVERAISHYFHNKRHGLENLSFEEAIMKEEKRVFPAFNNNNFKDFRYIHYSYKMRGQYAEQINRYLKLFPRRNIFITKSSDFFRDPRLKLSHIFDFLGILDESSKLDVTPKNIGKNKHKIDKNMEKYLKSYFYLYNEELYKLIGITF